MKTNRIFFQDFLFAEVPVDGQDFPMVDIDMSSNIRRKNDFTVSLDLLFRMNKKEEWDDLFHKITGHDVCIIDDVGIVNKELEYYKKFYLSSYYFNLKKYCRSCYVIEKNNSHV